MKKTISFIRFNYQGHKLLIPLVEDIKSYFDKPALATQILKAINEEPEYKSAGNSITWQYITDPQELNNIKSQLFNQIDDRKIGVIEIKKEDYDKIRTIETPYEEFSFPHTTFHSVPVIIKADESSPLIINDLLPDLLPMITIKVNENSLNEELEKILK